MLTLIELQTDFQDCVLTSAKKIPDFFRATQKVSVVERLDIYVHAYRWRLLEVLEANYPALQKCLGKKKFAALGFAYLKAHPSHYRSIRWFGDNLAEFMSTQKKYAQRFVEFASLEWTIGEIFDAADGPVMTLKTIAQVPANRWPNMRLQWHASVKRREFYFNVVEVWQAIDQKEALPAFRAALQPVPWILWRKELATFFCALTPLEAWAMDKMYQGMTWQEWCECLCEHMDLEQVPTYAAGLLKSWVVEGLISRIIF